ncbi:GDP-mannose 4,6-dehydratase, partial [Nostoc sp. NIES-2111]
WRCRAGLSLEWEGEGLAERGRDRRTGNVVIEVSKALFRPAEVDLLVGDASKARSVLGWKPIICARKLAEMMARADYDILPAFS